MSSKNASGEKYYTIEEIDKLLIQAPKSRAVALTIVPKHLEKKSKLDLANILVKICAVVSIATPVLKFAKTILFFKPKWGKIIDEVLDITSMACGTGTQP